MITRGKLLHVETNKITYRHNGDDAYVSYWCETKSFIF